MEAHTSRLHGDSKGGSSPLGKRWLAGPNRAVEGGKACHEPDSLPAVSLYALMTLNHGDYLWARIFKYQKGIYIQTKLAKSQDHQPSQLSMVLRKNNIQTASPLHNSLPTLLKEIQ